MTSSSLKIEPKDDAGLQDELAKAVNLILQSLPTESKKKGF